MKKIRLSISMSVVVLCITAAPLTPAALAKTPVSSEWAWSQQPWSDSDTAYLNSQTQIAALWDAKSLTLAELNNYKALSQAYPNYSIMLFRWGYYAFCYSLQEKNSAAASAEIAVVSQVMAAHPTPNSYYYARLRYLLARAPGAADDANMKQLRMRLLRRNPADERINGALTE